jgi:hypothetical protein
MKNYLILIFIFNLYLTSSAENNPYRTYYIKYILPDNGNAVPYEATMFVTKNRVTIQRNGDTKYWEIEYKGIIKRIDHGFTFEYHHFYLPNKDIHLLISDYQEIKHAGQFYYQIIIDGQSQLAR